MAWLVTSRGPVLAEHVVVGLKARSELFDDIDVI